MTVIRAAFAAALAVTLFAAMFAAEAQQPGKLPRIGLLDYSTPDQARLAWWDGFLRRMGELGYVEGQNIAIEFRTAEGRVDKLPGLASELVGLKVDVIVTATEPAARAAKGATSTIPIVMVGINYDPIALGYVASLARPGGNVTGVFFRNIELTA